MIIVGMALLVARLESWSRFAAVYWAFIAATTVGYGDFQPLQNLSGNISTLIALVGVTLTGVLVALAVNTARLSLEELYL